MKITTTGTIDLPAITRVQETPAATDPSGTDARAEPALQSAVLQPALEAMRGMPDIDQAKVQALRDALARGELPFDASKLAGLVQRFHGSGK
jgi:negative regulator of flagellin synthesis FlgM